MSEGPPNVYLVDDDPVVLKALGRLLAGPGLANSRFYLGGGV